MKAKAWLSLLLASGLIFSCITKKDKDAPFRYDPVADHIELTHEFRGVWLATVAGIDWPSATDNAATQQRKLVEMIRAIRATGCNAVFFQVVSNMDALYPSDILPWSKVLTGKQGTDPGYDPLELAIRTCREEGLQIHAWLNPLRCGSAKTEFSPEHIVLSRPGLVRSYKNSYYLNPALPEARAFLGSIATEIMTRYDLDGVHIDDYFYPDGFKEDNADWDDSDDFAAYGNGMDLEEWRYANINACIKTLYDVTHATRPEAVFGVSPQGRLVNTLRLYADPRCWVAEKTIDYLVPQIYWQHGHAIADFKTVLDSWEEIVGDVPMLTGMPAYRRGQTGFESMGEYTREIIDCRKASWVDGVVWFSTKSILTDEFSSFLSSGAYTYGSLVPFLGESVEPVPQRPVVTVDGKTLQWEEVPDAEGYAVYELVRVPGSPTDWSAELVWKGQGHKFYASPATNYAVLAYAGKEKSDLSDIVFVPSGEK